MDITRSVAMVEAVRENISRVIIGAQASVDYLLSALLAGGHVLIEDVPGTGKTMLARTLAASLDLSFKRIQFTPDLLPSDVTGASIYNRRDESFEFRTGPVFANLILADEINRATPRSQAAMLECMQEHQVSADGMTYKLPEPFFVIATQNPLETQGTFPLPEAQLDRFMVKFSMGYPAQEESVQLLQRFVLENPLDEIQSVARPEDILQVQRDVREIYVHEELMAYICAIVEQTRMVEGVILGASPRASLALMRASQAYALMQKRAFLLPDDVKHMAPAVLAHRMICRRSATTRDQGARDAVLSAIKAVRVPTEIPSGE